MKSRTLFSIDADVPSSESSCGYQNALLSWLAGFSRPLRRQQSAATWHSDDGGTEADSGLLMDGRDGVNLTVTVDSEREPSGRMVDPAVELASTEAAHNETWITTELVVSAHAGIVPTKLNVTYTAAADVISVLE